MITEYKYRKLRKMVKTAQVASPVKKLLFCTLRDYKKQGSEPSTGTFGSYTNLGNHEPRCLIGAAVHDLEVFNDIANRVRVNEDTWESAAQRVFGVTPDHCSDIIEGFDSITNEDDENPFRPENKTQRLAYRLGKELGV